LLDPDDCKKEQLACLDVANIGNDKDTKMTTNDTTTSLTTNEEVEIEKSLELEGNDIVSDIPNSEESYDNMKERPDDKVNCRMMSDSAVEENCKKLCWDMFPSEGKIKKHESFSQVERDVNRSLWDVTDPAERLNHRTILLNVINEVLLRHDGNLYYYQGYHDVVATIIKTMCVPLPIPSSNSANVKLETRKDEVSCSGETSLNTRQGIENGPLLHYQRSSFNNLSLCVSMVEKISCHYLNDCMRQSFATLLLVLDLIIPLVAHFDPQVASFLLHAEIEPHFCISWLITWFAHDMPYNITVRLFDVFLASDPLFSLYLATYLIVIRKKELFQLECEFSAIHTFLTKLEPENIDFDEAILKSAQMFAEFPPAKLLYTKTGYSIRSLYDKEGIIIAKKSNIQLRPKKQNGSSSMRREEHRRSKRKKKRKKSEQQQQDQRDVCKKSSFPFFYAINPFTTRGNATQNKVGKLKGNKGEEYETKNDFDQGRLTKKSERALARERARMTASRLKSINLEIYNASTANISAFADLNQSGMSTSFMSNSQMEGSTSLSNIKSNRPLLKLAGTKDVSMLCKPSWLTTYTYTIPTSMELIYRDRHKRIASNEDASINKEGTRERMKNGISEKNAPEVKETIGATALSENISINPSLLSDSSNNLQVNNETLTHQNSNLLNTDKSSLNSSEPTYVDKNNLNVTQTNLTSTDATSSKEKEGTSKMNNSNKPVDDINENTFLQHDFPSHFVNSRDVNTTVKKYDRKRKHLRKKSSKSQSDKKSKSQFKDRKGKGKIGNRKIKKRRKEVKLRKRKSSSLFQIWNHNYKAVLTGLRLFFYGSIIIFGSVAIIYAVLEYKLLPFEVLERLSLTFGTFFSIDRGGRREHQSTSHQTYDGFLATSSYIKNTTLFNSGVDSLATGVYLNILNKYEICHRFLRQALSRIFESSFPISISILTCPFTNQMEFVDYTVNVLRRWNSTIFRNFNALIPFPFRKRDYNGNEDKSGSTYESKRECASQNENLEYHQSNELVHNTNDHFPEGKSYEIEIENELVNQSKMPSPSEAEDHHTPSRKPLRALNRFRKKIGQKLKKVLHAAAEAIE